ATEQKADEPTAAKEESTENKPVNKNSNVKFDPSVLPESEDPAEMRKQVRTCSSCAVYTFQARRQGYHATAQVEFYFSDSNLRFDKFLFGLVGEENKFVPIKLIASFKRMKRFPNYDAIVKSLEESSTLELNEAKDAVRRKV